MDPLFVDQLKITDNVKDWLKTLTLDNLSVLFTSIHGFPGLVEAFNISHHDELANGILPVNNQVAPAVIGKFGEGEFERICNDLPSKYKVLNTAKKGKQGDFIIEYLNQGKLCRCMVDIKTYSKKVPTKEIEKFYEDLTYGVYDAGLLISYNSKFTGIENSIHIENHVLASGTIPIMYLSEIPTNIIAKCIEILFIKTETIIERKTDQTKIENVLNYINTSLQQVALTRRTLNDLNSYISTQIQNCQTNLMGLEVQIKHSIQQIKHIEPVEHKPGQNIKVESKPEQSKEPNKEQNIKVETNKETNKETKTMNQEPTSIVFECPMDENEVKHNDDTTINYDLYKEPDAKRIKELIRYLQSTILLKHKPTLKTSIYGLYIECEHFTIHITTEKRDMTKTFIIFSNDKFPPDSPFRTYKPTTIRLALPFIHKLCAYVDESIPIGNN